MADPTRPDGPPRLELESNSRSTAAAAGPSFALGPLDDLLAFAEQMKAHASRLHADEDEAMVAVVERALTRTDFALAEWRAASFGEGRSRQGVLFARSALVGLAWWSIPHPTPFFAYRLPVPPDRILALANEITDRIRARVWTASTELRARVDALPGRWSGLAGVARAALADARVPGVR